MNIQIIQVPYDSGHQGLRTGNGPDHFLAHGLDRILQDQGHRVTVERVETTAALPTEIGTGFELNRRLAHRIRSAEGGDRFPLVLAGNCNSCVGTIAGIDPERLGIVWFDAHGDFNTPETTVTGFLDGMGLAMATGRCWRALLKTIPGFAPVPAHRVVHVGARDVDAEERNMLEQAGIPLVAPASNGGDIREVLETALRALRNHADRIYLHLDMDVLATAKGQPSRLAVPGGLPVEIVDDAIGMIKTHFKLAACGVASFDPAYDEADTVLDAGVRMIKACVSA
jgi:arginase